MSYSIYVNDHPKVCKICVSFAKLLLTFLSLVNKKNHQQQCNQDGADIQRQFIKGAFLFVIVLHA